MLLLAVSFALLVPSDQPPNRRALVELRQASSAAARTIQTVSALQRVGRAPELLAAIAEVERFTADVWNRYGLMEAELLELGPDLPERRPCSSSPRQCTLELHRGAVTSLVLALENLAKLIGHDSTDPVFDAALAQALRYLVDSWEHLDTAIDELVAPLPRPSSSRTNSLNIRARDDETR